MDYEDLKIVIIRGLILIIPFIVLAIVIVFYIKPKHYSVAVLYEKNGGLIFRNLYV